MLKDISFETYEKQRGVYGKISDLREAVRELIDSSEVPCDIQTELIDVEIKLYDIMIQSIGR
jgi:hypothetical protein